MRAAPYVRLPTTLPDYATSITSSLLLIYQGALRRRAVQQRTAVRSSALMRAARVRESVATAG